MFEEHLNCKKRVIFLFLLNLKKKNLFKINSSVYRFDSIINVTLNVQQNLSVEKTTGSRSEIWAAGTFGDSGAWSPPNFVRLINHIPIKGADYPHHIGLFPQVSLEMVTKLTFCGKREIINDCRSEFRAAGKYRDMSPK